MKVNEEKCVGCGSCVPFCPVGAICLEEREGAGSKGKKPKKIAVIDFDECAECCVCLRSPCPQDALYLQELAYPRSIRHVMSDALAIAPVSLIPGRGTEEMKTNEVTGRFPRGIAGVAIEIGRPVTGARLRDVEKIATAVASMDVEFEPINPTTTMMADVKTGKFKDELLGEKVLSAIVEFSIKQERLPELFGLLRRVEKEIDAVFSLDIACRLEPDGSNPTEAYIRDAGLWVAPNGKTNVGLGRPLITEAQGI